MNENQIIRKEL